MMYPTSVGNLISCICLAMAIATVAQPVLDTAGRALQPGVDYYIKPAITDNGGRFTLINRNNSCPFFVGQENVSGPEGLPVTFAPFAAGATVVRESRDQMITFSASTICVSSTAWKVGETDRVTQRRLIVAGAPASEGLPLRSYFMINRVEPERAGVYSLRWCPTEVCPTCRFSNCGPIGALVENGKRLVALDGSGLPVVFERRA
ncbi:hypothetical protein ACFX1Q_008541 [Malus domestica]|uniref:kunitz type trypsin inhibitor 106-like n=1 Tax=Malus domestica TaxID=3750 RepID=UPI000498DA23|nr:kunitz trypsin inhibitor 2-like [Malus domestica]